MKAYFVEGLFVAKPVRKQAGKRGSKPKTSVEPFAKIIWAINAEDALRLATEELQGGQWVEPPQVSLTSEEKRMRAQNAPELPGLGLSRKNKRS